MVYQLHNMRAQSVPCPGCGLGKGAEVPGGEGGRKWNKSSEIESGAVPVAISSFLNGWNRWDWAESCFSLWPDGVAAFWKVGATQKLFAAVLGCAGNHSTAAFGAHIRGCVPLVQ